MATKQKPKSTAKKPAKKTPAKKASGTVRDRQARRAIVNLAALVRGMHSRLSSNNQDLANSFLAEANKCES